MNSYRTLTRKGLFGLLAAGLLSAPALTTGQELEELEEFVSTGSLIPSTETALEAGKLPREVLTRDEIDQYGYASTAQLLQNITVSNGGAVPISNNQTGFTPGAASVSLRALGPSTTLVLINGKRVAQYPRGTGGTTAFVDISSIPLEAVEQVEIFKDGASTLYGADAVAGVVNIILRNDYEGAEVSVRYGNTTADTDSSEFNFNALVGARMERTSVVVGAFYYRREAIWNRDREYSEVPPFLSSNSRPINVRSLPAEAVWDAYQREGTALADISPYFKDDDGNLLPREDFVGSFVSATTSPANFVTGELNEGALPFEEVTGFNPVSDYRIDEGLSRYNYNLTAQSFPETRRIGAYGNFEHEIYGTENIFFYGDFFFTRQKVRNELAPTATGGFFSPNGDSIIIPARDGNTQATTRELAGDERLSDDPDAYNPFNPFNADISGSSSMRIYEHGNRVDDYYTVAYALTGGFRAEDLFGTNFSLDVGLRYSAIETTDETERIAIPLFNRILNQNDSIFDPDSSDYIGTTVAYNPFNSFENDIPNNFEVIDYATVVTSGNRFSDLILHYYTLTNPEVFELYGGSVGMAVGYEHRTETVREVPDAFALTGSVSGQSTATKTDATRRVQSLFGEVEIPIFGPENEIPALYDLSVNLSVRFEDFIVTDKNVTVPKVSVGWSPIEQIKVRASWGEGFREPNLFELFAEGATSGLSFLIDPRDDSGLPEVDVTTRSNPDLDAEETESWNFGVVVTPIEGLTFAVDFWRIERSGTVTIDHQDVLERWNRGELDEVESVVLDEQGNIIQVNGAFQNLGSEEVQGVDVAASYRFMVGDFGEVEVGGAFTYLDEYTVTQYPGAVEIDVVGESTGASFDLDPTSATAGELLTPGSANDGYLQWKGRLYASWDWEGVGVLLAANYTDGFRDQRYDDDFNVITFDVEDRWIFDLQAKYTFFGDADAFYRDTTVTLGIRNLFDEDPPFASGLGNNSTGFPGFLYTSEGRFWYVQLTKKL